MIKFHKSVISWMDSTNRQILRFGRDNLLELGIQVEQVRSRESRRTQDGCCYEVQGAVHSCSGHRSARIHHKTGNRKPEQMVGARGMRCAHKFLYSQPEPGLLPFGLHHH